MVFVNALILSILLASPLPGVRPVVASELQQSQSSEQPPAAATRASPRASTPPKPCIASGATSAGQTNCVPIPQKPKHHTASTAPASSNKSTKVVRNGGTSEPIVAISPV